ncbi:hypothetical protein MJL33_34860, partial [Salmonella enterica subsp. enterica serovar Kentucky]|nr:hypothetical protein [Salmonella enterica subsp. enterica serovar Kentucky]
IVPLNQSRWDVFWPAQKKARALLVTCITGIGTAFKFKNLMEKNIELIDTSKTLVPTRGAVVRAEYKTNIGYKALMVLTRINNL